MYNSDYLINLESTMDLDGFYGSNKDKVLLNLYYFIKSVTII